MKSIKTLLTPLLLATVLCGPLPADAARVADLNAAAVPIVDRSPEERLAAVEEALVRVLVKMTGRRDIATTGEVTLLLAEAERYVLQEGFTAANEIRFGFDGAALSRELAAAALPVWGENRPATLVWLAVDEAGVGRSIIPAGDEGDLPAEVNRAGRERGLPLMWPSVEDVAGGALTFADVWGGSDDLIRAASEPYRADAILVGRAVARGPDSVLVRWRLLSGSAAETWRGTLADGVHGTADRFASRFSVVADGNTSLLRLAVSGMADLRSYATVLRYLQSLSLARNVAVLRAEAQSVVFEVATPASAEKLRREIGLRDLLRPAGEGSLGGMLYYDYQP